MSDGKPKISNLIQGVIECPNCSDLKGLSDLKELEVHECSSCHTPFFIPKKLKHYWLYRPLGGGGMGSVYKAISEKDSGEYAVKLLPREKKANQELIDTLMLEGEVGKILGKSQHIIEVIDYGLDKEEYFMISRFVEGTRLDVFVSSASKLSERQALDIFTQILEAEIHIKNCGYLFRDMKPENIIIVEETMTTKLFDFGLCMSIEQAAHPDPNSNIEGSPYYLPPERIVAVPEGEYSEVYSLGMLLFYMLSGTTYFSEADVRDLVTKHVRSLRVASVQTKLKECSPAVVDLIDKMIKRDPNQRYHTLAGVAEVLENISNNVEGYPLMADDPKFTDFSIDKRSSLNLKPFYITLFITGFIALVAGGIWFYWDHKEHKDQRDILVKKIAEKLQISEDVKAPTLSEFEIQKLIESKTEKIYQEELNYVKEFDETHEKIKICKNLGIDILEIDKPPLPLSEIRKLAKKELNLRIEKELELINQEFPLKTFELQIAKQIGVELPLKKRFLEKTSVIKLAKEKAAKIADYRYPLKQLSMKTATIINEYKCYEVGDIVTVPARSGEKITGKYQGTEGRYIVVDGKDILIADLPLSLSLKFDKALSDKKASDTIKKIATIFKNKKDEYEKSIYMKELEQIYEDNQYVKNNNKWIHASTFMHIKLKEKRKNFERKQREAEEKIITAVKQGFNNEEFYNKYGYRRIDNDWVSEQDLVKKILKKNENEFYSKHDEMLKGLKHKAKINAELEIYEKNGYIYRGGKWQPAKELFDAELNKELKKASES